MSGKVEGAKRLLLQRTDIEEKVIFLMTLMTLMTLVTCDVHVMSLMPLMG